LHLSRTTPEDLLTLGPSLHNSGARNWNSQITSETTRFTPLHDIKNEAIPGSQPVEGSCARLEAPKTHRKIQRLSAKKCRDELMLEIGVKPKLKGSSSSSRKKRKVGKKAMIDLTADESDDEILGSKKNLGAMYLD
jgi:hypothetical protein